MASIVGPWVADTGMCRTCGELGRVGASCDVCVRAAYSRALFAVHLREGAALQGEGHRSDAYQLALTDRNALLAGLVGHDLIREMMPGARMQAPEAP